MLTHLGRALMRPRWRRLADTKSPDGYSQAVGMQGVPRGNAWARFLGSFFAARQRMNINDA